MNVEPTSQPATDDPELAQVLAADDSQQPTTNDNNATTGLQFEESSLPGAGSTDDSSVPTYGAPATPVDEPQAPQADVTPEPVVEPTPAPTPEPSAPASTSDLENIKKDALEQLRPLVDRLDLPAEEKFDTLLLIIRSTDDQSLLNQAHEAAKTIEDDTKRAQALLDVVKEIDYFSNQHSS